MKYYSNKNLTLQNFFSTKMREMQGATKDSSTNVKELIKVLQTGEINGYKAEYNNNIGWYGGGWRISKKNDCHVYLFFGERRPEQPVSVSLSINEVKSSVWHGTPAMLYKCLDEFDSIEREFLVMLSKLEKLEKEQEKRKKIREITKNSAKTWIKELLKDSGYTYCIEEMDSKIALSVKMKNGTQLEIPIHYNRFQKIMPEVMNIIKEFERLLDEKGIKVLIVNARVKTKWTNK